MTTVTPSTTKGEFLSIKSIVKWLCMAFDELKMCILVTFSGECEAGWHCKQRKECPAFQEEQSNLEGLKSFTPEWLELVSKLTQLECDGEDDGVCCKSIKIINLE